MSILGSPGVSEVTLKNMDKKPQEGLQIYNQQKAQQNRVHI